MKNSELQAKFKEYAAALDLTIERSHYEGEKYITAKPGTIYLANSDIRAGHNYAIATTLNTHGAINIMYGFYSADHMYGYMQGVITGLKIEKPAIKPAGPEPIYFTRIDNDTNGNPRYVCHMLNLISDKDNFAPGNVEAKYQLALKRSRQLGGRKFHNKKYGGGIVFQSYNTDQLQKDTYAILAAL